MVESIEKSTALETAKSVTVQANLSNNTKIEKPKILIYIGESLPYLQKYTVLNNGVSDLLKAEIEKCSAIRALIVPLSEFAESKERVNAKGSREHILNSQIQQFIKGVKANGI